ncbi:hypothetical protein LCM02_01345 [Lutimonas saemankumensis]|uniref:hypothetical protein n=1 Tax=Lutimonas saemankumensis TaxID=483016 RepID=UPI001CD7DA03|nr:hypothetical protein [Lutimonas saemankumensis]MCA0931074.1 hypothetical protein [Lutimonas saemankumensis]
MIVEFILGVSVSLGFFVILKLSGITDSINSWILSTSKFVYFSGHPLMDDDEIFSRIKNQFKGVFIGIVVVLAKIFILIASIIILVIIASVIEMAFTTGKLPNFKIENLGDYIRAKFIFEIPFLIGTISPLVFMSIFRKKIVKKNNVYSPIDKFLHYVFLGNKNVALFLLKLEFGINKRLLNTNLNNKNVYVSGLARAGTTVLMQYLGQLDDFKSLSYQNLPFLFLPKSGTTFVSGNNTKTVERYHKDGVGHNIRSYEALEEPFWRNYIGQDYITDTFLNQHNIPENVYDKYNKFRKLVSKEKIYLAKNNNHLLRAESLRLLDLKNGNQTITIIPFRNPLEQSASLLKQHKFLSRMQSDDDFVLDYMNFLVHHEFGLNAKPFKFDHNLEIQYSQNKIEYWMELWFHFYDNIYTKFSSKKEEYLFFCYESFVEFPAESLNILFDSLDLPKGSADKVSVRKYDMKSNSGNKVYNLKFSELYLKLKKESINGMLDGQNH